MASEPSGQGRSSSGFQRKFGRSTNENYPLGSVRLDHGKRRLLGSITFPRTFTGRLTYGL